MLSMSFECHLPNISNMFTYKKELIANHSQSTIYNNFIIQI